MRCSSQKRHDHHLAEDAEVERCSASQAALSLEERSGRWKSMPNIRPLPRTAETNGQVAPIFCQSVMAYVSERGGVFDYAVLLHDRERGERGGHGQIVLAEGVRMDHAALHGVEDGIHDFRRGDDRADRHVAAGERLGDADDIRLRRAASAGKRTICRCGPMPHCTSSATSSAPDLPA